MQNSPEAGWGGRRKNFMGARFTEEHHTRARSAAGMCLATLLSTVLPVAGCGTSEEAHSVKISKGTGAKTVESPYSPNSEPKQALLDSTAELARGNFRFTVSHPTNPSDPLHTVRETSGSVHAPSRTAQAVITVKNTVVKVQIQYRLVGGEEWLRFDADDPLTAKAAGGLSGQWTGLDRTKLTTRHDISIDFSKPEMLDPTFSPKIIACASVRRSDASNYSGTIDFTKFGDSDPTGFASWAGYNPDQATAVPFRATVDPRGRLSKLRIDVPETNLPGYTVELGYHDYGNAQVLPRPENPKEANEQIYQAVEIYSW